MADSRTTQADQHRNRWELHPAMGFRLSIFDVALLGLGGLLVWGLWKPMGQAALLPLVVLGHFFLFCNVFRIDRRLELTWAAAFIINLAAWSLFSRINWLWILAIQTPLTVGLILYEVRHPRYHGIGAAYLRNRRTKAEGVDHKKEVHLIPGAIKISLYVGDLCTVPADVIGVSTNPHLELMAGTGGAVRDRGGWEIQEECKAIMARAFDRTGHRYLEPGSVVMTGAGHLPYQGVLLCVAIDPFHASSVEVIGQCTRGALELAASQRPGSRTIALPVFAAGNGQFDFPTALEAMLEAIARHKAGAIEHCIFVVLDPVQVRMARDLMQRRLGPFEIIEQNHSGGILEQHHG